MEAGEKFEGSYNDLVEFEVVFEFGLGWVREGGVERFGVGEVRVEVKIPGGREL